MRTDIAYVELTRQDGESFGLIIAGMFLLFVRSSLAFFLFTSVLTTLCVGMPALRNVQWLIYTYVSFNALKC